MMEIKRYRFDCHFGVAVDAEELKCFLVLDKVPTFLTCWSL